MSANTTPTSSLEPSAVTSQPEIRHAGPAHIRGRIRRVWRPRYLELLDSGQLRYYENNSNTHMSPNSNRNHILKYTLTVHAARILDGTTLRDLHVGLPRGAFGFLVRGQRTLPEDDDESERNERPSRSTAQQALPSPSLLASTTPGCGAWMADPQLAAVWTMATANNNHHEEQPVRDYLCAVETLEEAQMWVVALQWAASLQPAPAEQWWKVDVLAPTSSSTKKQKKNKEEKERKESKPSSSLSEQKEEEEEAASSRSAPSTKEVEEKGEAEGKTLVSKVVRYAVLRLSTWQLEIAYDIECLLVHSNNNTVEKWSIRRTASDLNAFVAQLPSEDQRVALTKLVDSLPRWGRRPSVSDVAKSLSVVDSLLRSWVLSPDLVNTETFQLFLGLTASASSLQRVTLSSSSSTWWQIHDSQTVLSERSQSSIPALVNRDQYVKQWLQRARPQPVQWHRSLVQLRHEQGRHLLWLGGAVAAAAVAPGFHRFWQRIVPVVPIRLDYLVVSWVGASYLGHRLGRKSSSASSGKANAHGGSGARVHHKPAVSPKTAIAKSRFQTIQKPISATTMATTRESPATTTRSASRQSTEDKKSVNDSHDDSAVMVQDESVNVVLGDDIDFDEFCSTESREGEDDEFVDDDEASGVSADELATSMEIHDNDYLLSSPLPKHPENDGVSCWSQPSDSLFHVRGATYFQDKVKVASGPAPLKCRGVDIWMTDDPLRHIARHPAVMGGKLGQEDTFLVNFLLPFANFVAYFSIPPLEAFPEKLRIVWTKFLKGDQEYRDARLKLLPYVVEGPWIVKTAVGPGKSPALLGKVIPLQYYFHHSKGKNQKAVYEVDVIITASAIAKGILSVVKSQTKALTIGFAFIIEAAEQNELPETVLCSFQMHSINLDDCPVLPECSLD